MRAVDGYPLWLGNGGDLLHPAEIMAAGIRAVIHIAVEKLPAELPRELVYCRFPIVDGGGNPPLILSLAVRTLASLIGAGEPTLICCSAGMSRTPALAAAGIALATGRTPSAALSLVCGHAPADVSPALWDEVQSALEDVQAAGRLRSLF